MGVSSHSQQVPLDAALATGLHAAPRLRRDGPSSGASRTHETHTLERTEGHAEGKTPPHRDKSGTSARTLRPGPDPGPVR